MQCIVAVVMNGTSMVLSRNYIEEEGGDQDEI